ncbi:MAG: peroxide stress protein YaaA [Flavobacteriia bacterium]|nr:peroxide stress protein YaaA [Flavobacteriia bacterium]
MNYVMLISPAKNLKKQAAIEPERLRSPRFMAEAKLIHRSMAKLKFQHIVDLMGVSATLARESLDMIKMWDHRSTVKCTAGCRWIPFRKVLKNA